MRKQFASVTSRNGDQNWPPRSCDLTPCDFFLWRFVKSHVYANKLKTIPDLRAEIRRVIGETEPQLCGNIIENFVKRTRVYSRVVGGICWILCSTSNRSVCTLYLNKNISTFWINGAFYSSSFSSSSSSSIGTTTLVGFRPAQLSLSILSRKVLRSAVASGTSNPPNLEENQGFRAFQLWPQEAPCGWSDASESSSGRWNYGLEMAEKFYRKWRLPRNFWVLLHAVKHDMGQTTLLPLRRKACWGFFRLKKFVGYCVSQLIAVCVLYT
jgi:hypothetical protein